MMLVPSGTSISLPSIVSLTIMSRSRSFPYQHFKLTAELLDVADVGPDRSVEEGADGGAGAPPGHVEDRVQVLFAPLSLPHPARHLVDPAGGLPARRALPARFVGVEAGHDHERLGDGDGLVHDDHARRARHGA